MEAIEKSWKEEWENKLLEFGILNLRKVKEELHKYSELKKNIKEVYKHITGINMGLTTDYSEINRLADVNYELRYSNEKGGVYQNRSKFFYIDFYSLYNYYKENNVSMKEISDLSGVPKTVVWERFQKIGEYESKGVGRRKEDSLRVSKKQTLIEDRINSSGIDAKQIANIHNIYDFQDFYTLNEKSKVPKNKSGIYLFYNEDSEICYIGKAKDLRSRITSHLTGATHTRDIYKEFFAFSLLYMEKYDEEVNDIEKDIIKTLNPKYNVIHNDLETA
ncbi:GIY-YIG nuclease family protein [Bacillus sp. T33-2]|uniref:GIY-YIG nuclease family protein n=1 Tax=Bacillus sp. T33-2 TaxID=2054168 RepID=UPI0015E0F566|nr:GIY-YIG nuclease family protein [Bacillus sp. T33-2]